MAQSCDTDALALAAKCFKCLPPGTLQEVQTYLLCQILANGGTGSGGGAISTFGPASINAVNIIDTPHGLGAVPRFVRGVMACVADDATSNYKNGSEIEACYFFDTFNACPMFNVGADATNVWAYSTINLTITPTAVVLVRKTGAAKVNISAGTNWRFKIYASL